MNFRAECVECRCVDDVEIVFFGNAEQEQALTLYGAPGGGGHSLEWNDQSNCFANAVRRATLVGRTLRIEVTAKAAKALGEAEFVIALECTKAELADTVRRLRSILGSKFTAKAGATGARTPAAPAKDYSKIRFLDLEGKNLKTLPEYVAEMELLETVRLARNPKLDFAGAFAVLGRLPNVKHLTMTTDTPIPDSIGDLAALETLQLTGVTKRQVLPEGMGRLKKLRSLLVMSDGDVVLPESMADLADLSDLNMRTPSYQMPSEFYRMGGLTELDLSNCRLARVPEGMAGMTGVTSVILGGEPGLDYGQMLEMVARMENVRTLELRMNPIPKEIGLCRQIRELVVCGGMLGVVRLPEELFDLVQLRSLLVNFTQLESVPEGIGRLKGLEELAFVESEFETLPETVGELEKLEYLCVNQNPVFREVPESLGRLTGLRRLGLLENPALGRLPDGLGRMRGLEEVWLEGSEGVVNVPESWKPLLR